MAEKKLTFKQEEFAIQYVRNKGNASAAYRAVYSVENMKEKSITDEASRLCQHPVVSQTIEKLTQQKRVRWGVDEQTLINDAKEFMEMAKKKKDAKAGMAVVNELNKMLGGHHQYKQQSENSNTIKIIALDDNKRVKKVDE